MVIGVKSVVDSKSFQMNELMYDRPVVLSAYSQRLKIIVGDVTATAHIVLQRGKVEGASAGL